MKKTVLVGLVCMFSAACGDGGSAPATSTSGSAKPATATSAAPSAKPSATTTASAAASAAPAGGDEITEPVFLGEIEKMFQAIHDNAADCAKMAEALKAVKPSPEREKALDAWEAKAKGEPDTKKRVDEAVKKLEEKYPITDGMKKCADDPGVKALMDKSDKKDDKADDKKDDKADDKKDDKADDKK